MIKGNGSRSETAAASASVSTGTGSIGLRGANSGITGGSVAVAIAAGAAASVIDVGAAPEAEAAPAPASAPATTTTFAGTIAELLAPDHLLSTLLADETDDFAGITKLLACVICEARDLVVPLSVDVASCLFFPLLSIQVATPLLVPLVLLSRGASTPKGRLLDEVVLRDEAEARPFRSFSTFFRARCWPTDSRSWSVHTISHMLWNSEAEHCQEKREDGNKT